MIRIDEIHENTFFAWLRQNRFGIRCFHMHPIGASSPEAIYGQGTQLAWEHNYITFFDAEPINLERFRPTFDKIRWDLAADIHERRSAKNIGYFVSSEYNSESVEQLCSIYGWTPLYYFFWGWAALDWYRGYDRTFLIAAPAERKISKTFVFPNRLIGGTRSHRLELLYYVLGRGLTDNYISCPDICPVEGQAIAELAAPLESRLPGISRILATQAPLSMPGEAGHPMTSPWLTLWQECECSLFYLVSETVATGRRQQVTEKTFKPIAQGMPFVIHSCAGTLEYLRSYGFRTFGDVWDESYDSIRDDHERVRAIADLVTALDQTTPEQKQELWQACLPAIEHNRQHFYGGAFERLLWQELEAMLAVISRDRDPIFDERP